MRRQTEERLKQLAPEVRVARMQDLLRSIVRVEGIYTPHLAAFMNLYDVHSPTITIEEQDGFLAQLDQPQGVFTEDTWNGIVWRYEDLRAGLEPSEAASVEFD